jgi:3-phenylpropionate/trans-cinnamate dioxygenase ferredoxin reductase subunit
MDTYDYLIVGGGVAAEAAILGIREVDAKGRIALIGAESHPPYDRPPLSKALWKGDAEETIWRPPLPDDVELHLGRRAVLLDLTRKQVADDQGTGYRFGKLLLATGGSPRTMHTNSYRVVHFRTVDDYRRLRQLAPAGSHVVVVGGGFIGSELAAALRMTDHRVTMLTPDNALGVPTFPPPLAEALTTYYRDKAVEVLTHEGAAALKADGNEVVVTTSKGRMIGADVVAVGIGIRPNVDLAERAKLHTDDGILVDDFTRTSHAEVYAAGDVARFPSPTLGARIRVEHEDNAKTMGRIAGRNMAGAGERYRHLPFFYSDLFDLGYEAVGEIDARYETVADWKEFAREGVVYYLAEGRVRGVLLWNVWEQTDAARALIAEPGPFTEKDLMGRI